MNTRNSVSELIVCISIIFLSQVESANVEHNGNDKKTKLEPSIIINNVNTVGGEEIEECKSLKTKLDRADKDIYWKNGQIGLYRELVFNGYNIIKTNQVQNESTQLKEFETLNQKITFLQQEVIRLQEQLNQKNLNEGSRSLNIVYAVNCGGDAYIDSNGIFYEKDPLPASDASKLVWPKDKPVDRVAEKDYDLYRSIRYNTKVFSYVVPIREEGDFVLVLKFDEQEVNAGHRVFDVALNKLHIVAKDLDIGAILPPATAHDVHVPFSVESGHLIFRGKQSVIVDNQVSVDIKPKVANAIISALYVMKGTLTDVPKLAPVFYPSTRTTNT